MKFRFLVFFLLASSSIAFGQGKGGSNKEYKNSLKAAKEHLRYEEFQQALPYVQELLKEDANSAYYNFWMGKCLYITYKENQALPYFEKVEKLNPDIDKEFYYWYGLTLHYNLYFDRAVEAYHKDSERYEPSSPEYVWVNNRITQCLYAKKLANKADAEQVKIENMGDMINSEFSEHSPVISANDSVLIYTARRPECLGAKPEIYFYDEDIYVSHKVDGQWGPGENIGKPVNAAGHDATISLTADGQTLYIYRHKKAGGLYVTKFDDVEQKWREPNTVVRPLNSKRRQQCDVLYQRSPRWVWWQGHLHGEKGRQDQVDGTDQFGCNRQHGLRRRCPLFPPRWKDALLFEQWSRKHGWF